VARRGEIITKLMEYGVLQHSLYRGLFTVGIAVYFVIASGIPVYSTVLREPGALGKVMLLVLLLLLSAVLAEISCRAELAAQAKTRRKRVSRSDFTARIYTLLIVLAVIVVSYVLISVYRVY